MWCFEYVNDSFHISLTAKSRNTIVVEVLRLAVLVCSFSLRQTMLVFGSPLIADSRVQTCKKKKKKMLASNISRTILSMLLFFSRGWPALLPKLTCMLFIARVHAKIEHIYFVACSVCIALSGRLPGPFT